MAEPKPVTLKDLINQIRKIIAIKLLVWSLKVAPDNEKDAYAGGVHHVLSHTGYKLVQPISSGDKPADNKDDSYYPERFWNICLELGLDPHKVLDPDDSCVCALIGEFCNHSIDEVQLMRSLRNLAILNSGKWAKVP